MKKEIKFSRLFSYILKCLRDGSCTFLIATTAFAGGYEIQEQSARGLGQAFAGKSAGFGDGSEVYYNPAAMVSLKTDVASVSVSAIKPSAKFKNNGSSLVPALGGAPLTGGNGGDAGSVVAVPSGYIVKTIDNQFKLGLGINSPYGLNAEYDSDWVGRYHAIKSDLTVININPALSYKVIDGFTLGLGLNNMYIDAELTNAIDFGSIGASRLGAAAAPLGLLPQKADGFGRLEGDDWAHGFNLGMLIEPTSSTKFGLAFKSKLEATVDGKATFEVPTNALPLTSTGLFTNSTAEAEMTIPESLSAGLMHEINDRLNVSLEGTWTRWTRFKEIRVKYPGSVSDTVTPPGSVSDTVTPGSVSDTVTPENWENTWRMAGGVNYAVTPRLTLRAGTAWEETPITSAAFRTPRIPDENRIWATVGASWYATDNMIVDIGYAHLFMDDASSTNTTATGAALIGDYDLSIDILSIGLTWELG